MIVGAFGGTHITAEVKSFVAEIKSVDAATGTFTALVSVFGNVDYGGDRMMPGSFTRTLAERGLPPIFWNHAWDAGPIGYATEARETEQGLLVTGQLFITYDLPARVHAALVAAMQTGSKAEFSFAYETRAYRFVDEDGTTIREVEDVELYECGPVVVGMNDQTRLVQAASRANRAHSEAPTSIQAAHDALVRAGCTCDAANLDATEAEQNARDGLATIQTEKRSRRMAILRTRRADEEAWV